MMVKTMIGGFDKEKKKELESCPVCESDMEVIKVKGGYGVRCPRCKYEYGDCADEEYLAGIWNALATTFPMSVHLMAKEKREST